MRNTRRHWRGLGGLALLVVLLGLGALSSARPSLAQGSDEAWAPVTIVYSSDIKGHIEPCG